MGILFPNDAVSRRWNGALEARLRRAPLEAFLRAQSRLPASAGVSQDSDNLAQGTVLIVEAGLALYFRDREDGLAVYQLAVVGHLSCLVSLALAEQIAEPAAWRIAALVGTAQLLSPWVGLNAAAVASASAARQFQMCSIKPAAPPDAEIMKSACEAVVGGGIRAMDAASASIAARLRTRDCLSNPLIKYSPGDFAAHTAV